MLLKLVFIINTQSLITFLLIVMLHWPKSIDITSSSRLVFALCLTYIQTTHNDTYFLSVLIKSLKMQDNIAMIIRKEGRSGLVALDWSHIRDSRYYKT